VFLAKVSPGVGRRPADTGRQQDSKQATPQLHATAQPVAPLSFDGSLANPARDRDNAGDMAFDDELGLLGFRPAQERRDGTRTFSLARNRYLTYWLHLPADDTVALFTWEFALGEYMDEYGLQVGANEPLNQYLFPQVDTEVAQDMAEVAKAMERTEAMFAGMDFGHRG
jgi:hypothetical protein